jgi:hypothetical protein
VSGGSRDSALGIDDGGNGLDGGSVVSSTCCADVVSRLAMVIKTSQRLMVAHSTLTHIIKEIFCINMFSNFISHL